MVDVGGLSLERQASADIDDIVPARTAVEHTPFYIHHLVGAGSRATPPGHELDAESIAELVSTAIIDPDDPWDLDH